MIDFTTAQVESGDEHRLLQGLHMSGLKDENLRQVLLIGELSIP